MAGVSGLEVMIPEECDNSLRMYMQCFSMPRNEAMGTCDELSCSRGNSVATAADMATSWLRLSKVHRHQYFRLIVATWWQGAR